MSYNNSHPGIEYGDGVLKGPAVPGQILKLVGGNEYSVVDNASDDPIGVLHRSDLSPAKSALLGASETAPCVVDFGANVIQTDQFTGSPAAGNKLTFDATTAKFKVATTGTKVVARVLAVEDTELNILWTNHGEVVA